MKTADTAHTGKWHQVPFPIFGVGPGDEAIIGPHTKHWFTWSHCVTLNKAHTECIWLLGTISFLCRDSLVPRLFVESPEYNWSLVSFPNTAWEWGQTETIQHHLVRQFDLAFITFTVKVEKLLPAAHLTCLSRDCASGESRVGILRGRCEWRPPGWQETSVWKEWKGGRVIY